MARKPAGTVHTTESVTDTTVATAVVDGHVMLDLDIDNLTPESLDGATVADVDALTIRVGADYAKRSSESTIRAAKATHLAYAAGILTPAGHKRAGHAITPAVFADRFGATRTNVYAWRVIGRAIMVHNIGADALALMLGKNLAQYGPLVEAIDAADATTETVEAAIADAVDPETGKRRVESRDKAIAPNDGSEVGKVTGEDGALVPVGRDLAGVSAIMVALVSILHTLSTDDYVKATGMIETLLSDADAARQNPAA